MTPETTVQDRFTVLNGLRFHYREHGVVGAPVLLLLHGLAGHARMWDVIATALADRFHVLALDLRGHGETDWAPAYSYDLFADDVEQFAADLQLQHFALVGQSLGAEVA
ncbi:MAG: alpha/beta fold hydrolase, partial [Dehalococcoidia bacterium]